MSDLFGKFDKNDRFYEINLRSLNLFSTAKDTFQK